MNSKGSINLFYLRTLFILQTLHLGCLTIYVSISSPRNLDQLALKDKDKPCERWSRKVLNKLQLFLLSLPYTAEHVSSICCLQKHASPIVKYLFQVVFPLFRVALCLTEVREVYK